MLLVRLRGAIHLQPPVRLTGAVPDRQLRRRFLPRRELSALDSPFFSAGASMEGEEAFAFGPYRIDRREVFYTTKLSYAVINLRPILPGHVLVCPKREAKRFSDLSAEEVSDLWAAAQEVGGRLEHYHEASSLTFAIQDGPHAGQTVPHVHIHIIPRKQGDFKKNDDIYDVMDVKERELKAKLDLDKEREDRTLEEMANEANEYRLLFK